MSVLSAVAKKWKELLKNRTPHGYSGKGSRPFKGQEFTNFVEKKNRMWNVAGPTKNAEWKTWSACQTSLQLDTPGWAVQTSGFLWELASSTPKSCKQATIHTSVVCISDGSQSYATISHSLRHDERDVWAHIEPILKKLKEQNPTLTTIHFMSDGPVTQYRNNRNFWPHCRLFWASRRWPGISRRKPMVRVHQMAWVAL